MLEYFLSMVVTEYTNLLDPTCGSGTAIRAGAKLGARSALGLELNPTVAATSATKLSLFLERMKNESES
jgi:23S rRNA G2445 N2-methylase RlmL